MTWLFAKAAAVDKKVRLKEFGEKGYHDVVFIDRANTLGARLLEYSLALKGIKTELIEYTENDHSSWKDIR